MKSNKVILKEIPYDIDLDDLRLYFESDLFDYKNIIDITEYLTDKDKKDVIIEFDTADSAKSVAKLKTIIYDHEGIEIKIRINIFYGSTKPKEEQIEQSVVYPCLIQNIPSNFSESSLETFFTKTIQNITNKFNKLTLINDSEKYQCIVNFSNKKDAEDVVEYFNETSLEKNILKAKLINLDSQNSSEADQEVYQESISTKAGRKIFCANHSRNFRALTLKIIDSIKQKYIKDVEINQIDSKSGHKWSLVFELISSDDTKLEQCFQDMKSMIKVVQNRFQIDYIDTELIYKIKGDMAKLKPNKNKEYFYFFIDEKKKFYSVEYFDTGDVEIKLEYEKFCDRIRSYFDEEMTIEKEIFIINRDYFDYLYLFFKKSDDLSIDFDAQNLRIRLSGKKVHIDRFMLINKNLKFVQKEVFINEPKIITYMIYKLSCFKKDLESQFILLRYSRIPRDAQSFTFRIVSPNVDDCSQEADKIFNFMNNVKVLIVDYDDSETAKLIEKKLMELKIKDCDVSYRDDKKKFFINGIDMNKLNLIKNQIENYKESLDS